MQSITQHPTAAAARRLDRLTTSPDVAWVAAGTSDVGTIAPAQPRFTFVRAAVAAGAGVDVMPSSAAAQRLLDGPAGQRWRDALIGVHQLAAARGAALGGIDLAASGSGLAVNNALAGARAAIVSGAIPRRSAAVAEWVDDDLTAADDIGRAAGLAVGDRVLLGVDDSRRMRRLLSAPAQRSPSIEQQRDGHYLASTVTHEVEHLVTTASSSALGRHQTLEEGTAESIARVPSLVAEAARAMGVPYRPGPTWAYDGEVATTRALLRHAGLDLADASQRSAARDLLQGGALERTPGRIARAIASHRGIRSNDDIGTVRDHIAAAQPTAAWRSELDALVERLAAP